MNHPVVGPIATALPTPSLDRARSFEIADLLSPDDVSRPVLQRLHDKTGIDTRRVSVIEPDGSIPLYGIAAPGEPSTPRVPGTGERMRAYEQGAGPLANRAAAGALERSGTPAASITHVVTASCTGFGAPGIDLGIIDALGLPSSTRRTHVGFMGCHAAVNALAVARGFASESAENRVLVTCVEISTVHFHHARRLDRLISNILFADGAASTVVTMNPAVPASTAHLAATSARIIPDSRDAMAWEIGDHGFEMTLAAEVPTLIAAAIREWVDETLAEHGLDRTAIGGWAIHPGGPKVIDAVSDALELPAGADAISRAVLRDCGNMSSATLLHILERFQLEEVPRPWVGLAFGPGLAGELMLVR